MSEPISGAQLTRLGERIRNGREEPGDDVLLADYLLSFGPFARNTLDRAMVALFDARDTIDPETTAVAERTLKSPRSIAEKLARQPGLRLDQMQDIVGCRIVTHSPSVQDDIVDVLRQRFVDSDIRDRRRQPSHGYRAIHLIVRQGRLRYEIQIRSILQHAWATLVERLIEQFTIEVKYGGGPAALQNALQELSHLIALFEESSPFSDADLAIEIGRRLDELGGMLRE